MNYDNTRYTSQINPAQKATATGIAIIAPRAKLRLRTRLASAISNSSQVSFKAITSFILGSGLIPLNRSRRNNRLNDSEFHETSPRKGLNCLKIFSDFGVVLSAMAANQPPDRIAPSRAQRVKPLPGQSRISRRRRQIIVFAALLQTSRAAVAQDDAVQTPIDLFDPERGDGVRIGSALLFHPWVEADATYDSNIYRTDGAKIDDLIGTLRPRFILRPDLSRHQIELRGGAEFRRFANTSEENSDQFDIGIRTLLDLASRTNVIAEAGFSRGAEQRGTSGDVVLTDSPVLYNRKYAGLLVRRDGGFLEMLGEARITETDYKDASLNGLPIDLSGRDARVIRARIRTSAPSSDHTRIFVEGTINDVSYDRNGPVSRNSRGYTALAGMHLKLTELIDIEGGAGYIHQDFDDPSVSDVNAINLHFLAKWTPRADWQITAAASRSVDPSPLNSVPAILRTDFSLEAQKAVSDRLLVSAEVGVVSDKYQGFSGSDKRFYTGARAHYRLAKNVGLIGRLAWRKQSAESFGRDYNALTATVGARIRF